LMSMAIAGNLSNVKRKPSTNSNASAERAGPERTRATRDPEKSRLNLIKAATVEFSARGFEGARVDDIAIRAGASKQLVYHYFEGKDDLYTAVLEDAYARLSDLRMRGLPSDFATMAPEVGIKTFVSVIFDSFLLLPDVIALIADENFHKAEHVRRSSKIKSAQSKMEGYARDLLTRGKNTGAFRSGVDPLRLLITILGLCSFYVSNRYTLSAIYKRNLAEPREAELWRKHIIEFVGNALQPASSK
jgi:TetR/AcrR family transcriptional regulator